LGEGRHGRDTQMKLGKLKPKFHYKTIPFNRIVKAGTLPSPATKVYREYKTPPEAMQMFGNDQYGDCTCAAIANMIILATVHTGTVVIPTLEEVLAVYSAVTGFQAGPPTVNDNGAAMTDILAYMQSTGMGGHKILGWSQIDHTNLAHRQLGVDWFAATYTGVQLPAAAQDQFSAGQPWEVTDSPIEGGHAILHPGYGSEGGDYVTWAKWDQKASSAWETAYIDEEYVIITEDWFNQVTKLTPGGLDLATLEAELTAIAA
jgi:hypothetical protein